MSCYVRINNMVNPFGFYQPCETVGESGVASCCPNGQVCMSNGFCYDPGNDLTTGNSRWSLGGCTDETYKDPNCPTVCSNLYWYSVIYDYYHTKQWTCCGSDTNGLVLCDSVPIGRNFTAPPKEQLYPIASLGSDGSLSSVPQATIQAEIVSADHALISLGMSNLITGPIPTLPAATSSAGSAAPSTTAATTPTASATTTTIGAGSGNTPGGISGGIIAAVVLGVLIGLGAIAAVAFFILRRRQAMSRKVSLPRPIEKDSQVVHYPNEVKVSLVQNPYNGPRHLNAGSVLELGSQEHVQGPVELPHQPRGL